MQFSYRARLEFLSGVLKEAINKVEFRSWKGLAGCGQVWTSLQTYTDPVRPSTDVQLERDLKMEASDGSFHASGVKPFNELA